MAKIVWSDISLKRLREIFDFNAEQYDSDSAYQIVTNIELAVSKLHQFPALGTEEPISSDAVLGDFRF